MKRRSFLIGAGAAAGALALGYRAWDDSLAAQAAALAGPGELIAGWVIIAADDTVTVLVPHIDMGQGSPTALAMMLAEELDADWSRVRVAQAPADRAFTNKFLAKGWSLQAWDMPKLFDGAADVIFTAAARVANLQQTGGSSAVRFTGQAGMRTVGAAARSMLVQAAAARFGVEPGELTTADSVVGHARSGRQARYGELAAAAARLAVPQSPPLKPRAAYRIVGRSLPRLDIPAKVTGAQIYGIDLRLPGLRHAAIKAAPVPGGRLRAVDQAPALAVSGVDRVVQLDDAVAVIASGTWQANCGLAALAPDFSDGGNGAVSSAEIAARQDQALRDAESVDLPVPPGGAIISENYRVGYLHHAAMEPINVTAQLADGRLTVFAADQNPAAARARLISLSGLPADAVTFHPMPAGGSFGRRGGDGNAACFRQAIALAKAVSPHPVKLIWSREEDFAQGAYRPAVATRLRAVLGADGRPAAWWQRHAGAVGWGGALPVPYAIPSVSIRRVAAASHVPTGAWRSVNNSQQGFFAESFVDELAHAAGRDPFEFRRDLLPPRQRRVLATAAEKAGWGTPLPHGTGRGIAIVESFGSVVAEVVEASLGDDGTPLVHRVVAAVDCGDVCHPDTATQQVEGAIIMGLSAAISEEITITSGAVTERNFPDYPLLPLARAPHIEVHFLRSDGPWGGIGEPGLPPAAPALANALFAATGRRLRRLPLIAALREAGA